MDSLTLSATEATVEFTLRDGAGTPLDRSGRLTQGAVTTGFVLGQLTQLTDGSPGQYTAYTGSTAPESGGTFTTVDVEQGRYRYRFAAPLPGFDPARTQTVLVTAARTFDGVAANSSALHSVRPSGGTPAVREEVTAETCASCHGETLSAHGGRFEGAGQCVLCHTAGTTDADTGNSLDWRVMAHKLHRGRELPSVSAGGLYRFVDAAGAAHDYSNAGFPREINECTACHAGAQGDRWKTLAGQEACTSCHDTTVFDDPAPTPPLTPHAGGTGPTFTPGSCAVCHTATAVAQSHLTGRVAPDAPHFEIVLQSITDTAPGQVPTVTFQALENGLPRNLQVDPFDSLFMAIGGPTSDFVGQPNTARLSSPTEGTLTAVDAANGTFTYTFPAGDAIPAAAQGSYALTAYGYELLANGDRQPLDPGPLLAFAVTGTGTEHRRQIVENARCESCHRTIIGHSDSRRGVENCVLCHNPGLTNWGRVSRFEGSTVLAESMDFRVMIHKMHMGDRLTQPYAVGSIPLPSTFDPAGTQVDFRARRLPRSPAECAACHLPGTWSLPMTRSAQYGASILEELSCTEELGLDGDALCEPWPGPPWTNPLGPTVRTIALAAETSVCTSCHDAPYVATHAAINTTPGGAEACATCHGAGSQWDVAVVHSQQ